MNDELGGAVMTAPATPLEVWSVCRVNDLPRPFTLCSLHGAQTLAKRDALNDALSGDGIWIARFEVPPGALAVHVGLPAGARCAECFGDPPCDGEAGAAARGKDG